MPKILFFYPIYTSFVRSDDTILQSAFQVRRFYFNASRKLLTPICFIYQLVFLLVHIFSACIFISHFSGYHSFLPALLGKIFGKPHFIILNGTECNNFPEYHYGYLRKPLLFWFSWKSMQWSTMLLPVSESLVSSEYTYALTRFRMQGFRHFYKDLYTPYKIIYNGVDIDLFPLLEKTQRPVNSFITISSGLASADRRAIKGIDLVIALARQSPENSYTLVGSGEVENLDLPSNIKFTGFVPHDQLHLLYNQHAFYLQISASEGFGLALCEAMLCGCVPIVSNVGILPFISGNAGYVLETKRVQNLLSLVNKAKIEYEESAINLSRKQITERFSVTERKKELLELLGTYLIEPM